MLRRLRVRTRLMTVIAVPLVLLLAVAGPEGFQRLSQARRADAARALTLELSDVAGLVDALQEERTLSAAFQAGDLSASGALAAQRTLVDGVATDASDALDAMAELEPTLADGADAAVGAIAPLTTVRRTVDSTEPGLLSVDSFGPMIEALLAVQDEVAAFVSEVGGGEDLGSAAIVARSKEATASQAAQLASAVASGDLRAGQVGVLAGLRADEVAFKSAYLATSDRDVRVERQVEVEVAAVREAGRLVDDVVEAVDVAPAGTIEEWLNAARRRQEALRSVESDRINDAERSVNAFGDAARRDAIGYAALAGLGLLVAMGIALLAARSITRPLGALTTAADRLAAERLPQLVEALRNPGEDDERYLTATIEPLDVRSDDELGQLSRAFNAVQSVAVNVAAEQSDLLRKGISDLFVNLARRNQSLIERQIQLLDRLESGEQDPDVLEHLYQLDHLATRMRRNAESLLVLAGAESGPRRSRPIPMADVVRAALGEVEDYERIDFGEMAPAIVQAGAVSDVAHILAELFENAAQFSPPSSRVTVEGARTGGSYQVMISDRGVGLAEDQVEALNAVLRDPPVTGLALGRSLGCLVAARLAARHGITVRLRSGHGEGVTAFVIMPRTLLTDDTPDAVPPRSNRPRQAGPDGWWATDLPAEPVPEVVTRPEPEPVPEVVARSEPEPQPEPARLVDALPSPRELDAGLQELLTSPERRSPLVERPVTNADALPVGAGLARRIPSRPAELVADRPAPESAARRSPEEVRSMLSAYRDGLQAGRGPDSRSNPEEEA